MATDRDRIHLGSGDLYLNNVNVGSLSGEVQLAYERTGLQLPPAGSGETNLVAVAKAILRATKAEFSAENLRLALGLGGTISNSVGALSYNPASLSIAAAQSWQGLRFGRDSLGTDTVALRFEHEKPDGKRICLILYTAMSLSNLLLPFGDDHVTLYDVEFLGMPDETRNRGDQIGIIVEEV